MNNMPETFVRLDKSLPRKGTALLQVKLLVPLRFFFRNKQTEKLIKLFLCMSLFRDIRVRYLPFCVSVFFVQYWSWYNLVLLLVVIAVHLWY